MGDFWKHLIRHPSNALYTNSFSGQSTEATPVNSLCPYGIRFAGLLLPGLQFPVIVDIECIVDYMIDANTYQQAFYVHKSVTLRNITSHAIISLPTTCTLNSHYKSIFLNNDRVTNSTKVDLYCNIGEYVPDEDNYELGLFSKSNDLQCFLAVGFKGTINVTIYK